MSQSQIRIGLQKKLRELDPSFQTAVANVSFKPTEGVPYQSCRVIPDQVENPTYGDNFHRENGRFEITLHFPTHQGEGDIIERADLIKAWFFRGLTIVQDGVQVIIRTTPTISTGRIIDNRYCVTCTVFYYSNQI